MGDLMDDFKKNQKYLKLGDGEVFSGIYIAWKTIENSFGTKSFRFTLERPEDGSRLEWDTGNGDAIQQMDTLIDEGLKKGSPIKIACKVVGQNKDGKNKYKYGITTEVPF